MKILSLAIQNKILLAILAGVVSIGSFQVWKYKKKEHEKFIANKETSCKVYIKIAETAIKYSRSLSNLRYNNIVSPALEQPGINAEFEKGSTYILLHTKSVPLLPPSTPVYDGIFFRSLLKSDGYAPKPLMVKAVSIDKQNKQATVTSDCTLKPFVVSLENLYEEYQSVDSDIRRSNPDFLF